MFWRRKKKGSFTDLCEVLKANSDYMYIGPEFMAVWHPGFDKVIIIPGNFQELGEAEANLTLQRYLAKMN